MTDRADELALVRSLREQARALEEENEALKGGGGSGTSGGMEARLAKLEAQMEHVQADLAKLANVPADLAALKVEVGHLPTKDYLTEKLESQLRKIGLVVAIIAGVCGVAFKFIA